MLDGVKALTGRSFSGAGLSQEVSRVAAAVLLPEEQANSACSCIRLAISRGA